MEVVEKEKPLLKARNEVFLVTRKLLNSTENEKLFFFKAAFKYGKGLNVTNGLLYVIFYRFIFFLVLFHQKS